MTKWQAKRFSNPCFLPTLSVVLLCLLPNHPFSNLDFSSLGQPIFLTFVLVSPNGLNLTTDAPFLKMYLIWYLSDHIKLCVILWLSELGWPQPRDLHILDCHSFTYASTANYHTSYDRGDAGLSYGSQFVSQKWLETGLNPSVPS